MCCRPHSIAVRRADRELPHGAALVDDRSRARSHAAEIAKAEDEANRIVWEDRPVTIRFATAEEAAAMPLRKESGRTGSLRLIDVEDYDLSACGGTHVERTGAIGIIAIGSVEKFKGGSRVEFCAASARCSGSGCGVARWRRCRRICRCRRSTWPRRSSACRKTRRPSANGARIPGEAGDHEAHALLAKGSTVIAEVLEGWDPQGLKAIAVAATAAQPNAVSHCLRRPAPRKSWWREAPIHQWMPRLF
jgi:alanyl-tRNA synthetase